MTRYQDAFSDDYLANCKEDAFTQLSSSISLAASSAFIAGE